MNRLFRWLRRRPKLGIIRVTEEEFDQALADYARAVALGDFEEMRKGYVVLRWMCLRKWDDTEPN